MRYLAEVAQSQDIKKQTGKNFTAVHSGPLNELQAYQFKHPLRDRPAKGKLFIKDHLDLTGMQVSLNKMLPGTAVPFTHSHKQNEELFIIISGKGQMIIDSQIIDVEEGSSIRIAPDGIRSIRSSSDSELIYICIQAKSNSLSQDTLDDGIPGNPPNW
jgi:mannose-6-phosphate isomerase-like protein (cupin superfamily)